MNTPWFALFIIILTLAIVFNSGISSYYLNKKVSHGIRV